MRVSVWLHSAEQLPLPTEHDGARRLAMLDWVRQRGLKAAEVLNFLPGHLVASSVPDDV